MIYKEKARQDFDIESISSKEMDLFIQRCGNIYRGQPYWLDDEDEIKTVNFAKTICAETAKLTCLAVGITIDGSARANWLQSQIDNIYFRLRDWVEFGCAYGTVALKPNGNTVDVVLPQDFMVTSQNNGKIDGCVFYNKATSSDGHTFYARLEYHRFVETAEGKLYMISNECYVGEKEDQLTKKVSIESTPWNNLLPEIGIIDIEKPLFSILKMPGANIIDTNSAMGIPRFADAIQELKDLDIAYSRNTEEIFDSRRTVLMDSDKLLPYNTTTISIISRAKEMARKMRLPRNVRNVENSESTDFYQEINPNLNTEMRMKGINALLSQIGFKCGFSNGYFVFNEKTGMVTATQVEADDRRTIQTIKDCRDALESCLDDLIYALDKFADLYDLAPVGAYKVTYDFGDLTYSYEEDKQTWWRYVQANKVPTWLYFVKFEGMSEQEAKAMVLEAQPQETGIFNFEE